MNIKSIAMFSAFLMIGSISFGQTSNLRKTAKNIQQYDELRVAGTPQLGKTYIEGAKEAIDAASVHDKTKDLAETWMYYALVYSNLATADKSQAYADKAKEGIEKATALDKDGKHKQNIEVAEQLLGSYNFNQGVANWEKKDFKSAYSSFSTALEYMPGDTTLIYYSGLAAIQNQDYKNGIEKYKQLIDRKDFSSHKIVMVDLPKLYLSMKDTASAIEYAAKAVEAYPEDKGAAVQNIELNLIVGNNEQVLSNIQSQIAKDPQNKNLYYYLGIAESANNNSSNALAAYNKAIELDPNYADANLNAGVVLMNQVRDELNELNSSNVTATVQNAKLKELKEKLKPVEAFFTKVIEVEPANTSALRGLKQYYDFVENEAKSKEIAQKLEDAQK
ncbi:tetratricopeptide repeat protein [Sphingobacterium sp. SGG-5]|uniref:tetratricopeptide repeat protein n=1 Tax=Sphingobacterium sp. SGG-5 TaxID=2710881 RepID=UPI0013ED0527|nr:tetratricopeptide repeat protein [Sphingobacterium sp. SGG-5]NGM61836.1 tetratricopeptide repeat protein [Sphingobacterium sp. SGG-5]